MSLGLSGIGLSFIALFAPYQRLLQFFAIGMLLWSHYRIDRRPTSKSTVILTWTATIAVMFLFVSPLLARFIFR
jgi:hypothetical protein